MAQEQLECDPQKPCKGGKRNYSASSPLIATRALAHVPHYKHHASPIMTVNNVFT